MFISKIQTVDWLVRIGIKFQLQIQLKVSLHFILTLLPFSPLLFLSFFIIVILIVVLVTSLR